MILGQLIYPADAHAHMDTCGLPHTHVCTHIHTNHTQKIHTHTHTHTTNTHGDTNYITHANNTHTTHAYTTHTTHMKTLGCDDESSQLLV